MNINGIEVEIVRKAVRRITLKALYGPRFIVTVPQKTSQSEIVDFLLKQESWLKKTKAKYDAMPYFPLIPKDGESVVLLGKKFVVKSTSGSQSQIKLTDDSLIFVETIRTNREKLYDKWKTQQLSRVIEKLLDKWSKITGLIPTSFSIKKVKSKWGWCNIKTREIGFSQHLIYQPVRAIESVVLHELVHFLNGRHDKAFYSVINKYMPDYKQSQKSLVMP